MHIRIDNVRGIAHAEFDIEKIALVGGDNGAGKTSVVLAMAAALTDNVAPIAGMLKSDSRQLLREGASKGEVVLSNSAGGIARIAWPSGKISSDPDHPQASALACGLYTVAGLKPKDMADALGKLLALEPTLAQLKAALPDVEPGRLAAIWKVVESDGWDAAQHRAKENGAKAKGAWEHVTQTNYGPSKAAEWKAPNIGAMRDENVLIDQITEAREHCQNLQRQQALGDDLTQRLTQQKQAGLVATEKLRKLQPEQNHLASAVGALRLELRKLPEPEDMSAMPACPSCGTLLVVETHDKLRLPTPGMGAEENARRKKAIEAKRAEVVAIEAELDTADNEVNALQAVMRQGLSAARQLEQAPETPATAEEIEAATETLRTLQASLVACQAQAQADNYHQAADMMGQIADALAPTGVRQTVLVEKLGTFNDSLAELCQAADWPPLQITNDLALWYGVTPYWLCSASEQFRARVVLQLAMSEGLVLIDGADILGKQGRNDLMQLLHITGRPALVCMTLPSRDDMPNLEKAGYGKSYWIEGGTLQ